MLSGDCSLSEHGARSSIYRQMYTRRNTHCEKHWLIDCLIDWQNLDSFLSCCVLWLWSETIRLSKLHTFLFLIISLDRTLNYLFFFFFFFGVLFCCCCFVYWQAATGPFSEVMWHPFMRSWSSVWPTDIWKRMTQYKIYKLSRVSETNV